MENRKRGRKPVGKAPTINKTIRLLPSQAEKLDRLGGAKWVRARIERAKDKEEVKP